MSKSSDAFDYGSMFKMVKDYQRLSGDTYAEPLSVMLADVFSDLYPDFSREDWFAGLGYNDPAQVISNKPKEKKKELPKETGSSFYASPEYIGH